MRGKLDNCIGQKFSNNKIGYGYIKLNELTEITYIDSNEQFKKA